MTRQFKTSGLKAPLFLALGLLFAAVGQGLPAQTPEPAASASACRADTTYHPFDFWVGRWTVQDSAGKFLGTDEVTAIVGGCAFVETWHDADGTDGQSLFYFAIDQNRWKQVWVTPAANRLGGYKEKRLIARLPGGAVRFQGELVGPRAIILDRTTLTPQAGRVHQVIEISRDGGTTWLPSFDGFYVPLPSPAKP
jgi:hypothetical protein